MILRPAWSLVGEQQRPFVLEMFRHNTHFGNHKKNSALKYKEATKTDFFAVDNIKNYADSKWKCQFHFLS